jgi:hypothetical protein
MRVVSLVAGVLVLARIGFSKRRDDFVVKHAWKDIPKGWRWHGPAPDDHTLEMRIGLKQDRLDELISTLYEVSDPGHRRCVQALAPCTTVRFTGRVLGMVRTCPRGK